MIIPHLIKLGDAGLQQSMDAQVIEVRPKNDKKTPFEVKDVANVEAAKLLLLRKLDESNFLPTNKSAREVALLSNRPAFFRGIPLDDRGITQTTTLVKLVDFVLRTRWYQQLIESGTLNPEDAKQRVLEAKGVANPKKLASEKNRESGCQLPVIGKSPSGKWVILGLRQPTNAFLNVDEELSVQLTTQIARGTDDQISKASTISHELQTAEGRGRNAFGKVRSLEKLLPKRPDEAMRVFGQDHTVNSAACLELFNRLPRHRIRMGENPETSHLLFIPYRASQLDNVAAAVKDVENNNRQHQAKKKNTEETLETKPVFLPTPLRHLKSKVIAAYKEDGKKKFWIVTNLFPEVPLYYWQVLNEKLRPIQGAYVAFFHACLANPKTEKIPRCAYRDWTDLLTAALNREPFDRFVIWRNYATFLRQLPNQELLGGEFPKAKTLRTLTPRLRELHHLIQLMTDENNLDLNLGEIKAKVDAASSHPKEEETAQLLGPLWEDLLEWQQAQLCRIHRDVCGGIPARDVSAYLKGALCGILLNNLVYQLSSEEFGIERRFDLSAGMHLTNLRGQALINRFLAAKDLVNGLPPKDKARVYQPSRAVMNHLVGMTEISKTDAFNTGFVSNC
jgi:hypothetical protein